MVKALKGCEKYSLQNHIWSELPAAMEEPRHSFTPCVYPSQIYLSGGSSPFLEVLDPTSDSITKLGVELPSCLSSVSVIVGKGLLVLWRGGAREVDLETEEITIHRDEKDYLFSAVSICEPVTRNGELYWTNQDGQVTWVNLTSFQPFRHKA